jgi:hypothetical protein
LQTDDKKFEVRITQEGDRWQLCVKTLTGLETPQFKQFVESLNDYLFSIMKAAPNPDSAGLPKFEVFFDDIYFDMSGPEAVVQRFSSEDN